MKTPIRSLSATALVCLLFLAALPWAAEAPAESPYGPVSFAPLVNKVKHTVVNISTTQKVEARPVPPGMQDFFGFFFGQIPQQEYQATALGSGVIIDSGGLILTNTHVVDKATQILVKLDEGREYDAEVVGTDEKTDLALIRVKPDKDFPSPAAMGNSDALSVGDWVMAVGNPFGLGNTVTSGIISATGRIIGAGPYDDFLQTDAAINPGNSGGPLFNMDGEVVGINTAIVARGQNLGFAIPINLAKSLLPQLKTGKVIRGWLGVGIQNLSQDLAEAMNVKPGQGVLVSGVMEGGPADKAGIRRGDIITKLDGQVMDNAGTLSRTVAAIQPGTRLAVTLMRDGKTLEKKMEVGTMPGPGEETKGGESSEGLGISVTDLTPELAARLGLPDGVSGVLVSQVKPGSPGDHAGLSQGDLIREVDNKTVANTRDFKSALGKAKAGRVLFYVQRGDNSFYVAITLK